jgi:hypothetical protein
MNHQFRLGVLVLSISNASAFADQMIYMDHNANIGPKHEALLKCVDAARSDPAIGTGLMFSTQMGVSDVKDGSRTFILNGTAWENGTRVPVTARCVVGPRQTVASVTRMNEMPALAEARK